MPDYNKLISDGAGTLVRFPSANDPAFTPGETYISVTIRRISLKRGRVNLRKYGPYVWGVLGQTSFDQQVELAGVFAPAREDDMFAGAAGIPGSQVGAPLAQPEFSAAPGPMQAESFRRLDRMLLVNRQLTPRLVFQDDGPFELGFGAILQKDHLAATLSLVEQVVKSPVAQFVSALVPPVGKIVDSASIAGTVRRLLGRLDDDKGAERLAAVSTRLSQLRNEGGQLLAGTYAMIAEDDLPGDLRFDPQRQLVMRADTPFEDAPYLAFDLQCETTRPDWGSVPDVNSAWRTLEAQAMDGDVEAALASFRSAVYLSPDLVPADSRRLHEAARRKLAPLMGGAESFSLGGLKMPALGPLGKALRDSYEEVMAGGFGEVRSEWDRFHRCHEVMRINEGGYVDHPSDPGGATNKGVTQGTYDAWRKRKGQPRRHVREIDEAEVMQIYFEGYWRAGNCHRMPNEAVALVLFDACVNHGAGPAMKFIQRGAGLSPQDVDGAFGPRTLRAVEMTEPTLLVGRALDARWRFFEKIMARNPKLEDFRRGWRARVDGLRAITHQWLTGQESALAPLPDVLAEHIAPPQLDGIDAAGPEHSEAGS